MRLFFLAVVFAVIVLLLALRRPLWQAILGGLAAAVLLYRVPLEVVAEKTLGVFTRWDSFSILLILYLITYLQRMLEARQQIKLAQQDLNRLFHDRRVNAAVAPLFIGLLPSAAAMILCGDIVKESTDGWLDAKEQAFVTNWFRHIPESTLPTYTGVLLMTSLSGVPLPQFMAGMVLPVLALFLIGWWPCIHRLPRDPGTPPGQDRKRDALGLLLHLWPLLLILALILGAGLSVVTAVLASILLTALVHRFSPRELLPMVKSAFEKMMLLNTFLVLVLKELLACTGVLELLPGALSALPIPPWLVFSLLFFLGGIISGANGIIALGTPMAFAAIPGGMPLMVLLMGMTHAASMVSPVHVCLAVAAEYYHITPGELIRKSFPAALAFCLVMMVYYQFLLLFWR